MENQVSLFVNTAFIIGCIAMAGVFMVLPLPSNAGLKKYRISLRFLAGTYLLMALLEICVLALNPPPVNLISMDKLSIASLQASMFTFALITLLSPRSITWRNLYLQLTPALILNILYLLVASRWGNPVIQSYQKLLEMAFQPSIFIRELFVLFYIAQLGYLTRTFIHQARKYENEIDNYFADNYRLQLSWVRYCFYAALCIGICAVISSFILSERVLLGFTGLFVIFYLAFGICYIQYPRTYLYIEPAIYSSFNRMEEPTKNKGRMVWADLKNTILTEKYYLNQEVNIEEMARYLKIGRTSLSRFINNEEGLNFNSWINLLRIEESKILLVKYPDYTLIEISEMVGYSESSNFSRHFKHITTKSPSVWRQTSKATYKEKQTFHSQKQIF